MAGFRYDAVRAADGKSQSGVIEADNLRAARASLREQGLWPTDLAEITAGDAGPKVDRRRGLNTAQLALFTRQFSTLLDAGLTIEQGLSVAIEQAEQARERDVLAAVRSEILAGSSLSAALARQPKVFPELYRTVVRAAEESGKSAAVLGRLADYIEARQALASKVGLAFVYPAVVLVVSLLVIIGMLTWVVPQMVTVFQSAKQTLPLLTRALLAVSGGLKEWGVIGAIGLGVLGVVAERALRYESVRRQVDGMLLKLPLFGRFERAANTARLASTLAILTGSGVPLLNAMNAAAGVVSNRVLREVVHEAAKDVREGATLSSALGRAKVFPPVLVHLIASGEASGRLETMLDKAAQQQTGELEARVSTFTSLLGPLMVLAMGGVVLLIVLAILLPVFEMNQMVK
ncbi:type II secretion system inner membrane protein GspF [Parachitinimonas caeni]|uniref:Type II secretion system inner membrane protein GspF n=1 Tax=Parachitinimonas caeni TaxID=3031301 RepID=A0ABT7E0M4_9NEIS|nr:type II secretion system inner membrane protein GspF [Parachitinimonas caeni]MDK2125851.1 type II secretion system inner membrane protein GspF [Parachitinimonas caeni]